MSKTNAFRSFSAFVLCLCLLFALVRPGPSHTIASTQPLLDPSASDIADGAKQFDDAVRDIEVILTLDLTSEKGAKQAAAIVERNARKLANVEKKAIHAAMRATSFERGLKAEAAKRKGGADELVKELQSNPESVANIAGAEDAARAIRESLRPAAERLKKVGEALKRAAEGSEKSAGETNPEFLIASYSEPVREAANARLPLMSVSVAAFCGSYKYICDVLAYLGAWYLWGQMRVLTYPSRVNTCIVGGFQKWKDRCRNVGFYDFGLVMNAVGCDGWFVFKVNACVQELF